MSQMVLTGQHIQVSVTAPQSAFVGELQGKGKRPPYLLPPRPRHNTRVPPFLHSASGLCSIVLLPHPRLTEQGAWAGGQEAAGQAAEGTSDLATLGSNQWVESQPSDWRLHGSGTWNKGGNTAGEVSTVSYTGLGLDRVLQEARTIREERNRSVRKFPEVFCQIQVRWQIKSSSWGPANQLPATDVSFQLLKSDTLTLFALLCHCKRRVQQSLLTALCETDVFLMSHRKIQQVECQWK